jgi:nicotinamide riboside kinase
LLEHGSGYNYEDLLTIAKGQIESEEKYIQQVENGERPAGITHSPITTHHLPLFIDTDMYVMKVWCEYVFGKCHPYILEQIHNRKYDLYLLCNTDLPWVKDELREYPDLATREKLYQIYKSIMQNQTTPWVEISGNYEERLKKAIEATNKIA